MVVTTITSTKQFWKKPNNNSKVDHLTIIVMLIKDVTAKKLIAKRNIVSAIMQVLLVLKLAIVMIAAIKKKSKMKLTVRANRVQIVADASLLFSFNDNLYFIVCYILYIFA